MKRPMYLKERNLNPPLKSKTRERFEKREGSDKAPTLLGQGNEVVKRMNSPQIGELQLVTKEQGCRKGSCEFRLYGATHNSL